MSEPETQLEVVKPKAEVLADDRGLKFRTLDELWRFAVAVVGSRQFKDIDSPEVALIRLQAGMELGLSPIWSLTNIMVVNGKPACYGDGMLGLVLNHPKCDDVIETMEGEGDDLTAVCEVHRKGRLPVKRSFSVSDAKTAGLWGKRGRSGEPTPWVTYPARMLKMRARAWACRDAFADALRGLGVVEELRDIEPEKPAKVIEKPLLVLPEDRGEDPESFMKAAPAVEVHGAGPEPERPEERDEEGFKF